MIFVFYVNSNSRVQDRITGYKIRSKLTMMMTMMIMTLIFIVNIY